MAAEVDHGYRLQPQTKRRPDASQLPPGRCAVYRRQAVHDCTTGKNGIEERGKLCSAYAKCYRDAYAAEPNEVRKDGKARREANTRLREYINKKFLRKMGQ